MQQLLSSGMAKEDDSGKVQWESFLHEWGGAFEDARHIVHILGKEAESLARLELGEFIDPCGIEQLQRDWVRLCGMMWNPLERDFFKPWWVPLEKDSHEVFMDLSDKRFPVFRVEFFFFEPYRWYREPVVDDISSLLLASERGTDLDALHRSNEEATRALLDGFFRKRKALAFDGALEVSPPDSTELRSGEKADFLVGQNYNVDFHSVRGIGPLAIGLLPFDLPVILKEISVKHGSMPSQTEGVRCVRDLVYLLRTAGLRRISSYFVETRGERVGSFAYLDNELSIANHDKELVKEFFGRLSSEA